MISNIFDVLVVAVVLGIGNVNSSNIVVLAVVGLAVIDHYDD